MQGCRSSLDIERRGADTKWTGATRGSTRVCVKPASGAAPSDVGPTTPVPDGQLVDRLEAALENALPGRIAGLEATREVGAGGARTRTAPNP